MLRPGLVRREGVNVYPWRLSIFAVVHALEDPAYTVRARKCFVWMRMFSCTSLLSPIFTPSFPFPRYVQALISWYRSSNGVGFSCLQVNKYLWGISRTKQLWISVIRDLGSRQMLDRGVDEVLEETSTEALIAEAKRAVVGPHTWSKTSVSPPTISRQVTIPFDAQQRTPYAEFLPGGRHILFYTWYSENDLQATVVVLWDVHLARQIWRQARLGHVISMRFDFRAKYEVIICLLSQYVFPDHIRSIQNIIMTISGTDDYYISLLEVDISTGVSRDLIHLSFHAISPSSQLQISGDYVVWHSLVQLSETVRQSVVVLIKISIRKFIVLGTSDTKVLPFILLKHLYSQLLEDNRCWSFPHTHHNRLPIVWHFIRCQSQPLCHLFAGTPLVFAPQI